MQVVGLFVNATADEIAEILKDVHLDILQFHGDESPEQCQQIANHVRRRWYKAIQVKPDATSAEMIRNDSAISTSRCECYVTRRMAS